MRRVCVEAPDSGTADWVVRTLRGLTQGPRSVRQHTQISHDGDPSCANDSRGANREKKQLLSECVQVMQGVKKTTQACILHIKTLLLFKAIHIGDAQHSANASPPPLQPSAPPSLPRVFFSLPTGCTVCQLSAVSIRSPSLDVFQLFSLFFFSRYNRVGNGSPPMCLKPHLFVPKGVYKLDARVAGRFTQGPKSLEALSDTSNARPAVRKTPYELLHFVRECLLWSVLVVFVVFDFFFFHPNT